jgi:hypothetical protein
VRVDRAQAQSGVRGGRERPDLQLGVLEEEAHDLSPGIPARPGNCDPHHLHDYTEVRDSMHPSFPDLLRSSHLMSLSGALSSWLDRNRSGERVVGGVRDEGEGPVALGELLGTRQERGNGVGTGAHEPSRPRVQVTPGQPEDELGHHLG